MDMMYQELASILENNVDIIICETMSHSREARSALASIQESKSQKWIGWTLYGNQNTLPSGETITEAFNFISDLKCDAYLINCGGANLITEGIKELKSLTNKRIGGYGNSEKIEISYEDRSDRPEEDHWASATSINEKEYAQETQLWVAEGASIVAGCCRTRPAHIAEIAKTFNV
jgi:homocysteine S-methyltransferase